MASTPQIESRPAKRDYDPPPQEKAAVEGPSGGRAPGDRHRDLAAALRQQWRSSLAVFAAGSAVLVWLFWSEISAAVHVWSTSRTFGHAFFIFPICLFLFYRLRHRLAVVQPRAAPLALVAIVAATLLWILGELANLMVVKQLAFVGLWQSLFFLVLGWRITWAAIFPLTYLYLAVPFGYAIIPPLQDVTAQMVVQLLRFTGMPVFLDGYLIQIPTGSFLVAEACSGVRYLIVSVALGILAAHLLFRSWTRRIFFVGLSILVPILANGIRAYGIIMLAHLSDYELAIDVDHIIYGFVFLSFVTLTLLGLAALLRDRNDPLLADLPKAHNGSAPAHAGGPGIGGQVICVVLATGIVISAQTWIAEATAPPSVTTATLHAPVAVAPWSVADAAASDWLPQVSGADASLHQRYHRGNVSVDLHISYFTFQREGGEAISDLNSLLGEDQGWKSLNNSKALVEFSGRPHPVTEMIISKGGVTYLVWFWYRVGDETTNSRIVGKLLEMKAIATGAGRDAAVVAVGAEVTEDTGLTRAALKDFLGRSIHANGSLVQLDAPPALSGQPATSEHSVPDDSTGGTSRP